MAKNLNVSLAFTANTNEAIAAIKRLQKELNGLATGQSLKNSGISQITPEIQKAMVAAGELQAKLEAATNLKTGKLDLSQFSDSLRQGGVSLQQYANQLSALGPAGRQAFTNLAQSVLQAEAPLIRCSQRVKELGTTLANTARWQISSSILHGFMGTIQSAYGYAQDLNKSLNDIRIVTGASVSEMDSFAAKANKAARALSTTTNEYAKASLIYFQQGDTEAEAMAKANVTAKMANVTGQSAEVVSNQLTAIWNNFNKEGDQSYEHFADVLTKLGAATASSTDEIAGGLEKFAGIADQIGLSYEYAASALATITATSRESEDVVGTALKTIFARIQGLNLGETLDDGTTLNKYSEALEKVGISIFDQAGELKDMDDILEEMADKWQTLSRDQQTALAQTVAGVRQYNQLMTLMNNWDVMDTNLATAASADGELNKQAEIYAEGWEAARDRVQAAAEGLYAKILDDDFFIGFLDGLSKAIDGVGGLIDAFGGLKGVLFTVGAFVTKLFHDEMVKGLKNAAYNLKQLTPLGKQEQEATKTDALNALKRMKSTATGAEGQAENAALEHEVAMQQSLMANAKSLTDEEMKQLQIQMDLVRALDKRAIAMAKAADAAAKELESMRDINKVQAQMDAKMKARTEAKANAKEKGETAFTNKAFKAAETGGRKTMVEQYYKQQKRSAEAQVRQAHGLDAKASLKGLEGEVQAAFVNGIRQAANAEGASDIAKKVGAELEHNVSSAMSGAAKKMQEAMANARKEIEAYDAQIDKAAKASASAKSLGSTTKNMSAFDGSGDDKAAKSAKELAALQDTLKSKIIQTREAAEQLAGSLSDQDMDIQLNDDINELKTMEQQLENTSMSAEELQKILDKLNAGASSGDYEGMTIGQRIGNAADIAGAQAEADGTANTTGENVDFTGHYAAAQKKAEADIGAGNAGADSGNQKKMFDEKMGDSKGMKGWADGIANTTNLIMGLGSAITSVQGAIDVFNNPDASNWDKFSAVMSVMIGLLPVLSSLFTMAGTAGTAAGAGMTAAMGPVGWIILAVVAAVALLTAGFIALSNAYNADAIAAKKAAENAEKLAEASDKTKQQLDGIKKGFEAYDTAVEKLNNCVRGTDEWNAALKEVNDTVMGLLKSYPELLNQKNLFTRNADGMLEIDETKRDAIIEEAERQAQVAEAAALVGAARASEARAKSQNTDTQRQIGSYYSYDSEGYVDARVDAGKIMTENKDQLAGLTPEEFEAELRNLIVKPAGMLDSEYESMIGRLMGYQSSIDNLVTATDNAATQMDNATMLLANSALGDEHNATEIAAGAQAYEEAQEEIYNKIIADDAANNSQADTQTDTARDIWRRFQEASGVTYELANNAIQGNDNNRVYAYKDETGKEQTYSIEYIAQTIAASEAMQAMGKAADDAAALLGQLGEKGTAFAAALGQGTDETSMANFLSGMTQEQLDIIGNSITTNEDGTMSISQEGLDALGVTEEQFAQLAETFGISVQDLTANLAAAQETVDATISDTDKNYFASRGIDTSNMTIGEQQEFLNNRDSFNSNFLGADTYSDSGSIIQQNADIDPEVMSEFMGEMGKIDLTAEDATEQVRALVKEYGIEGDAIDKLIGRVDELPKHFNVATDAIAESIGKVNSIVEGLETGDTISQEDYSYLEDLGIDMSQYFMKMSDGTWKLVGDAEAFANMVNSFNVDQLKEQYQDFASNRKQTAEEWGLYSESTLTSTTIHSNAPQNTHKARADYLQSFDGMDFKTEGAADILALDLTNENLQITAEQVEIINQMIAEANAQELLVGEQIASTAQSVDELNDMLANGEISAENYDKALQAAFENEIKAEGFDSEELNNYAEALMNSEDALVESREEANRLAIAHAKMERGINDLVDNWDSWNEALENGSEKEKVAAMGKMKKAMADIIGVDVDQISDKFLNNAEAMELMEKAANGDMEALDALGPLFAKEYIADIGINNTNFQGDLATLQTDLLGMLEQFQMEDIEIGTSLDTSGYAMAMTEMMAAAGTDIDTINSILAGMGFEPEVSYVDIPVDQYSTMVSEGNTTWSDSEGNSYTAVLDTTLTADENGMVKVPVINGSKTTFKGGGSSAASSGAKKGGGGGGGGGGKPKKADKVKKTDVVERYKEIDDKLDDIADKMNDASKAADRLWGPARLKEMKKVNEALEEEIDALKQKRKEAQDNLDIDKQALKDTIKSEAGVTITDEDFDENGNFTKYDEVLTDLYEEIDAAVTEANADGNADEDEQEKIAAIQERIDKVKEAISQYDDTKELVEDLDNDIQDKIYEWQDNNYEQLNYKLEYEIEINDSELELLEYYMGKTEGNIYKTAEAFGYLSGQADIYTDNLKHQEEYVNELTRAYYAGEISMDAYKEGLREAQSATIENLQALEEQKKAMQEYYGEVMDMALEEISLYTDEMEELNSVLDHYSNILELVGKQEDYATKGKVLQSKATNLRNEMQVQQELYEKSNAEAEKWASKMATAVEGSNEYETYKKNWIAAQEAANEAQDNMLSKTEEWAEAMKAVVENELAGLAKTMEESLTGGTSFDELLTSMERRSSLQEEYLTTTNQIYETNKLMRQAQQEIDKTTNSVAKRKLANFISETEQMQEQGKLSQYELDIQQAKYDLLLAEIALEEAQSAKSTVRLQRDSEGNFGYVYTADQGAVGEAEQNLADKQNALYNIGLEGANDYSQKYAETMQEAQDAITELTEMWMNGEIASEEEFQRRKAEIQDYYYEKLKQYSSLYQVALTTDSNVIADAWSTDFNDMIYKTDDWKTAVDGYFEGAAESMQTWAEVCGTVLEESGLDDVSKKVEEIDTKSNRLKETLIGEDGESGVVGAMMSEVEAAGKLSEAYIGIQNQIDATIRKYEEMLGIINEEHTNENTPEVDPAIDPEEEPEEPTPEPEPEPEEPTTPELKVGSTVTVKKNASRWASGESIWNPVKGNNFKVKKIDGEKILIGDPSGPNYSASGITGWIKKTDLEGFATGGYTGDWEGSYGKLAMLHQKELVLNANDTENFLQAMDILDKIVSAIDLYSMNSQLGGALSSPTLGHMGGSGDILEQQVHIEASFPGVQDRNEIEEAFNTLINRASQYANRK